MNPEKNIEQSESSQAIGAFEQILQVVPDDMFAMEALHDAYLEMGETRKAFEYLHRLASLAKKVNDADILTRLSDKLLFLETEYPEASKLAKELDERSKSEQAIKSSSGSGQSVRGASKYEGGIHQEIALAWNLYEGGQINKDDYTNITNDLTETSSRDIGVPVTVMHALYDRASANTEKIVAFIARTGHIPLISLGNFELQEAAAKLLPLHYMTRLGALPFDFIGDDLMVAILNPFNKELRESVIQTSGRHCHFYLVIAPDYDHALNIAKKFFGDQPKAPDS